MATAMGIPEPADDTDPADVAGRNKALLSQMRRAHGTVRIERRRTNDERAAFAAFRSRLDAIPATTSTGVTPDWLSASPQAIGHERPQMGTELLAVRDAYRSTVMSVPHYEEEYNDTYVASLAAEFGLRGERDLSPSFGVVVDAGLRCDDTECNLGRIPVVLLVS